MRTKCKKNSTQINLYHLSFYTLNIILLNVAFLRVIWVLEISVNGPVKNNLSTGVSSRIFVTSDPFVMTCDVSKMDKCANKRT